MELLLYYCCYYCYWASVYLF